MKKNLMIVLTLLLVIPGLMFTVSCAKKTVSSSADTQKSDDVSGKSSTKEMSAQGASQGPSEMTEEELARQSKAEAMEMFLNEDIYFDFDMSDLRPDAQAVLRKKAEWLRSNPDASIVIEGHCDERGTTEYNLALGDRRAQSAKTFLKDLGISAARMSKISYGEEMPIDPGHNEAAWIKNRRAHFTIK